MSLGNLSVNQYWDAATNTPKLVSGKGTHGQGYIVSNSGTTTLNGVSSWQANDLIIFVLDQWIKLSGSFGGGGGVVTGAAPEATRAQMNALNFTTPPDTMRTNGFAAPGDGGHGFYKKVSSFPTHWPDSGKITPTDGSLYQLIPDHGDFWVEQFGAQGRAYNDTTDQWQFFEDCKSAILLQPNNANWAAGDSGGLTLRAGRGVFYYTKPHSMEGATYNFKGSGQHNGGTTIRTPHNIDAIQIQHGWGEGTTFGHEGDPLNGFQRFVGQLVYVAGQTHVYKCTNTGTPDLAHPPTGTGTGITSGTATFDYYRERTWAEMRGIGADYSVVSDIQFWSTWNRSIDGYNEDQTQVDGTYPCCILMRTRATIQDVFVKQYEGHGIAIAGDGDPELRGSGNVNAWVLRRVASYYNGRAGVRVGNADANAGMGQDIDTAYNDRAGIEDFTLLGNRWLGLQDAFSGSPANTGGKWYGGVNHNGYSWIAMAPEVGGYAPDYTLEPGTLAAEFTWIRQNGDGTLTPSANFPAWNSANAAIYAPCGGYISNNINAENQIVGLYIEGGGYGPQLGVYDAVWGGPMGNEPDVTRGGQLYLRNKFFNALVVNTPFKFDSGAKELTTQFGGKVVNSGKSTNNPDSLIWGWQDYEGNKIKCRLVGSVTGRDWQNLYTAIGNDQSGIDIMAWTNQNTTYTFGRSTPQPYTPYFPKFGLGDGGLISSNAATIFQATTSHLGTGTTAATGKKNGEFYFYVNTSAVSTDPWGWVVRGGFYIPCNP